MTLDEFNIVCELELLILNWEVYNAAAGNKAMIEIECPEWAVMKDKPLVRLVCQM